MSKLTDSQERALKTMALRLRARGVKMEYQPNQHTIRAYNSRYEVVFNAEDGISWIQGTLIQNAMPYLTADQREFLISGLTPDEWPYGE